MAYLDLKKQFIQITGNYDLVVDTTSYASATPFGIDDVIWSGQRLLESLVSDRRRQLSWERKDILVDSVALAVKNVRVLKEVWISSTDGKTILEKKPLGWLRETFGELSGVTAAKPLYWVPAVNKLSPNQITLTAAGGSNPYTAEFSYDADDIQFGENWSYDTILYYPKADKTYTMSVLGKFFEKKLTVDADVNFWTEEWPLTLITAGQAVLERIYRNRTGYREHLDAIQDDLRNFLMDYVDEEISGINKQAG